MLKLIAAVGLTAFSLTSVVVAAEAPSGTTQTPAASADQPKRASGEPTAQLLARFKSWNPDADSTVDLAEAKEAAAARFTAINRDADQTIDEAEAKGTMNKMAFVYADTDKNGTIDLKEYNVVLAKRFARTDIDKDGTIDAKEIDTKAGRSLARLLK